MKIVDTMVRRFMMSFMRKSLLDIYRSTNEESVSRQISIVWRTNCEELLTITDENDIGIQIQSLRRQYMLMKKSILPLKEQYVKLLRAENLLIHKVNRAFFK